MSVNLYNKTVVFQHFSIHYFSFKNVSSSEFVELLDAVNTKLFENKASIVSSVLCGNKKEAKTYTKAIKKVFDEVNWPLAWIGNSNGFNYSGNFIAISGANMKTFLATGFISKVFDTPDARFAFFGEVVAASKTTEDQFRDISVNVNSALGMVGLETDHLLRSWYYGNDMSDRGTIGKVPTVNNSNMLTSYIACSNQHKKPLMASFFACQPKNENLTLSSREIFNDSKALLLADKQASKVLMLEKIGLLNSEKLTIEDQILKIVHGVEELINESGFQWNQMYRGVAYFRDIKNVGVFKNICKEKHIPMGTLLLIQPDAIESNIDFEFEADFANVDER